MLRKKIRKFNTKSRLNTELTLVKKINLKENQQITFVEYSKGKIKEYDVVKKDWGYYATPSINKRLKKFKYECALIKNKQNKFFLCLINKNMKKKFILYLKDDDQKIVCWLNSNNLKSIENLNLKNNEYLYKSRD